jgi:hypothetical protein
MKLMVKFGLAALLVAFLAVSSLAERKHPSGETKGTPESYKVPAAPSPVPTPYPNVEPTKTKTGSRVPPSSVKGEASDVKKSPPTGRQIVPSSDPEEGGR